MLKVKISDKENQEQIYKKIDDYGIFYRIINDNCLLTIKDFYNILTIPTLDWNELVEKHYLQKINKWKTSEAIYDLVLVNEKKLKRILLFDVKNNNVCIMDKMEMDTIEDFLKNIKQEDSIKNKFYY